MPKAKKKAGERPTVVVLRRFCTRTRTRRPLLATVSGRENGTESKNGEEKGTKKTLVREKKKNKTKPTACAFSLVALVMAANWSTAWVRLVEVVGIFFGRGRA